MTKQPHPFADASFVLLSTSSAQCKMLEKLQISAGRQPRMLDPGGDLEEESKR